MQLAVKRPPCTPRGYFPNQVGCLGSVEKPDAPDDEVVIGLAAFVCVDSKDGIRRPLLRCPLPFRFVELASVLPDLRTGKEEAVIVLDLCSCPHERGEPREAVQILSVDPLTVV